LNVNTINYNLQRWQAAFSLRDKSRKIAIIFQGDGIKNKTKIMVIIFVHVIYSVIKTFFPIKVTVDALTSRLWNGLVVNFEGIKYSLIDEESYGIISGSESFMSLWFQPRSGDIILDIGAHIGKYTLKNSRIVGNSGFVLAIEANPVNFQTLKKNIKINKVTNVIAVNLAAWNENCKIKLFTGLYGGYHSTKTDWSLGFYEVEARRMDDVMERFHIEKVDWIKIDAEGAEYEVLKGLKKTICKQTAKVVVEVFESRLASVKKLVRQWGYAIIKISPNYVTFKEEKIFSYFLLIPSCFSPFLTNSQAS
jgi:FkbM family methyltransferase